MSSQIWLSSTPCQQIGKKLHYGLLGILAAHVGVLINEGSSALDKALDIYNVQMKHLISDVCSAYAMANAGQKFDMESKTFTLGNMFAMRLHQYAAEISEITNAAIKELTIESELKKLADVWKAQKFDLFKYTKGGMDDRGWILKSKSAELALLLSGSKLFPEWPSHCRICLFDCSIC